MIKVKSIVAGSILFLSISSTIFAAQGVTAPGGATGGSGASPSPTTSPSPVPGGGPGIPGVTAPGGPTGGGSIGQRRGSSAPLKEVMTLQQVLKEKGQDPGPIDGILGPKTKSAIKSFQRASGLEQTGEANKETREKLGIK